MLKITIYFKIKTYMLLSKNNVFKSIKLKIKKFKD